MDRLKAALFGVFAAALTLVALSPAYLLAQAPGGLPSIGPGSAFNSTIENYMYNGPTITTAAVTAGCNGAGVAVSAGSSQQSFRMTGQTSVATTCTITWPVTWSAQPRCILMGETTPVLTVTTMSTTSLVWTFASTANAIFDVYCSNPR